MSRTLQHPAVGVTGFPLRSPTLPPATHTNCWVLGHDPVLVVDPASPWTDEQQALAAFLGDRTVEALVLTHHHPDHIGGVEALRSRTGAPVWAHRLTAKRLDIAVDRTLDEGDLLGEWRVVHTPGHAPGHLCLFRQADNTLVTGDMVAGLGTIVLDPPDGDLGLYLGSLARLHDLEPTVLLPAHGDAIHDAMAYLQHYIDHRHMRTDQVRAALATGPASPADLVPAIYADVPELFWPIAARQVLCHLLWLLQRQEVERIGSVFMLSDVEAP